MLENIPFVKSELNENFVTILDMAGMDFTMARYETVLGSNVRKLRFGSMYGAGEWTYNEDTGVAVNTTVRINRDEDKDIIEKSYVNLNNTLKLIDTQYI